MRRALLTFLLLLGLAAPASAHGVGQSQLTLRLDGRRLDGEWIMNLDDARKALDRVPTSDPNYPMALFKRAQVSVLLREPDAQSRIAAARARATPLTRTLIEREQLFR